VLTKRVLAKTVDLEVRDVRCRSHRSSWSSPEESTGFVLVFVRRGCFRRRVDGSESVLDPAVVYFARPGEEQQIAHPCDGGDACTAIALSDDLLAALWGGEPGLPAGSAFTTPRLDLAQRFMLAACAGPGVELDAEERVVSLVSEGARGGSAAPGGLRATGDRGCTRRPGRRSARGSGCRSFPRSRRAGTAGCGLPSPSEPHLPGSHRRDGHPVSEPHTRPARPGAAGRGRALPRAARRRAGLCGSRASRTRRQERGRRRAVAAPRRIVDLGVAVSCRPQGVEGLPDQRGQLGDRVSVLLGEVGAALLVGELEPP
jgi:hypothetical protein